MALAILTKTSRPRQNLVVGQFEHRDKTFALSSTPFWFRHPPSRFSLLSLLIVKTAKDVAETVKEDGFRIKEFRETGSCVGETPLLSALTA
jgi:hypothetical protein